MQTTPKKIYAIDNGLIPNVFQNLVYLDRFLDLRRQGKKIFYYLTTEGYKIDFITQDSQGRYEMIQVVWDMTDLLTLEREQRALHHAEKELGFSGKLIDWTAYCLGKHL